MKSTQHHARRSLLAGTFAAALILGSLSVTGCKKGEAADQADSQNVTAAEAAAPQTAAANGQAVIDLALNQQAAELTDHTMPPKIFTVHNAVYDSQGGYRFDPARQAYVSAEVAPVNPLGDFTVDLKVQPSALATAGQVIFSMSNARQFKPTFSLLTASGGKMVAFRAFMRDDQGHILLDQATKKSYAAGVWHQLAFVKGGNTGHLYVDGQADPTVFTVKPATGAVTLNRTTLGAFSHVKIVNYFNGLISRLAVYAGAVPPAASAK